MASPKAIRRLAFQVLFQIDARGRGDTEPLTPDEEDRRDLDDKSVEKAVTLAGDAFDARDAADREVQALAPGWPAHRQPAVDRAILRLAHFEMTSGRAPARVAVNEAVDLAREFGTEKSPGFVNAILDKVMRRLEQERRGGAAETSVPSLADQSADQPAAQPADASAVLPPIPGRGPIGVAVPAPVVDLEPDEGAEPRSSLGQSEG